MNFNPAAKRILPEFHYYYKDIGRMRRAACVCLPNEIFVILISSGR
jgi:hypothetical protein